MGQKAYELSNHLGNVLATVSDRKWPLLTPPALPNKAVLLGYQAELLSVSEYYPFGMEMPGRIASSEDYRYGFNGKEKDDEVKGSGAQYDYGFRVYDARMGRFLSVDPLSPDYPWYTPFQFAGNKPIRFIDLDGLEEWDVFLALNDEEKVTGALVKLVKSEGDLKVNWYGGTLRDGILLFQKNLGETNSFRGPSTKVGDLLNENLTAQEGGFSVKSTGESFHKDKWVIVGLRGDNGNYLTRPKSILIRFPVSSDVSDEERVNLVNKTLEENLPSLKETVQDVPDGMLAMYFNYIPDVNDPKLLEKTSSTINSFFPSALSSGKCRVGGRRFFRVSRRKI